jgi:hypothetical protein
MSLGQRENSSTQPSAGACTTNIAARVLGQWLAERMGQSFAIDNRPAPRPISAQICRDGISLDITGAHCGAGADRLTWRACASSV